MFFSVCFLAVDNIRLDTTVKYGDKERFDKEQIGVKETLSLTNCQMFLILMR